MLYSGDRIKIVLQLRDGPFGRTLRSRKGLMPLNDFYIDANTSYEELIRNIRDALPENFIWDVNTEPIRYQRIKEQPQSSLPFISRDMAFYQLFKSIIIRRKYDEMDQISIWIFGKWKTPFGAGSVSPARLPDLPKRHLDEPVQLGSPAKRFRELSDEYEAAIVLPKIRDHGAHSYNRSSGQIPPLHTFDRVPAPAPSHEWPSDESSFPASSPSMVPKPSPKILDTPRFVPINVRMNGLLLPIEIDVEALKPLVKSLLQ
jgi:hypothetical protein